MITKPDLIETWKKTRDRLNKRQITDAYIEYHVDRFYHTELDADCLRETFEDLMADPFTVKLTIQEVRQIYFRKFRDKHVLVNVRKPCNKSLCNGLGVVAVVKFSEEFNRCYEYAFACPCILGYNERKAMHTWKPEFEEKGYKIIKDTVYTPQLHAQYMREDKEKFSQETLDDAIAKVVKTI